jgi:hypothetical protein
VKALVANSRTFRVSPQVQALRRANLRRLADLARPTRNLAALLDLRVSLLRDIMAGTSRTFGGKRAREIESQLGLPEGWLDRDEPVPASLKSRMREAKERSARPGESRAPGRL